MLTAEGYNINALLIKAHGVYDFKMRLLSK